MDRSIRERMHEAREKLGEKLSEIEKRGEAALSSFMDMFRYIDERAGPFFKIMSVFTSVFTGMAIAATITGNKHVGKVSLFTVMVLGISMLIVTSLLMIMFLVERSRQKEKMFAKGLRESGMSEEAVEEIKRVFESTSGAETVVPHGAEAKAAALTSAQVTI